MTAYMIFERRSTSDEAGLAHYAAVASATTVDHPIKVLSYHGALDILEGPPVEGVVLLQFPTVAEARAWYDSPAYQAAAAHRHKAGDYSVLIIDGTN